MNVLLFTFKTAEIAAKFDLTRLGVISSASGDGLALTVEPEDEWATARNLNLMLMAFGLYGDVMVTEDFVGERADG